MNQENLSFKHSNYNWKTINIFIVFFSYLSTFDFYQAIHDRFLIELIDIIADLTFNTIFSLCITLICVCIKKYLFKNPHYLLSVSLATTLALLFMYIFCNLSYGRIQNYWFNNSTTFDFFEPFLLVMIFPAWLTAIMLLICDFLYNTKTFFKFIFVGIFIDSKYFRKFKIYKRHIFSEKYLFKLKKKKSFDRILCYYLKYINFFLILSRGFIAVSLILYPILCFIAIIQLFL